MKSTIAIAATLAVMAAPLSAQATPVYVPSASEGSSYSYYIGRYANSHCQNLLGGSELGTKAGAFTSLKFRIDGTRSHSQSTSAGRSWTKCTLMMAQSSYSARSTIFARNMTNTPTSLYSGPMTWTQQSGIPKSTAFGKAGQVWKFTRPYIHVAGKDEVIDFTFSGGKMKNNAAWSTSRGFQFYQDGAAVVTPTGQVSSFGLNVPSTRLNNIGTTRTTCNDSAITFSTGAYLFSYMYLYGPQYANHAWRSKIRYYTLSYYTAPGAPVIHALGLGKNVAGIDILTGCNKLHMNNIVALLPLVTWPKSISTNAYSGFRELILPHPGKGAGGLEIISQAFWIDSKTKQGLLSQADTSTVPAPWPTKTTERWGYISYNGATATSANFSSNSQLYNPVLCLQ